MKRSHDLPSRVDLRRSVWNVALLRAMTLGDVVPVLAVAVVVSAA